MKNEIKEEIKDWNSKSLKYKVVRRNFYNFLKFWFFLTLLAIIVGGAYLLNHYEVISLPFI
jgi:hypothetical protein